MNTGSDNNEPFSDETRAADAALLASVEALTQQVGILTPKVGTLQQSDQKSWRWIKGGVGFIAFDVVVTLIGVIFGFTVYHIAHDGNDLAQQNHDLIQQVAVNQERLNTTVHEFCGLYSTFIGFYNAKSRANFAAGPEAYDRLYAHLIESSKTLDCKIPTPPGLGG